MKFNRIFAILAACAVIASLAGGCAKDGGESETSATEPQTSVTEPQTTAEEATADTPEPDAAEPDLSDFPDEAPVEVFEEDAPESGE